MIPLLGNWNLWAVAPVNGDIQQPLVYGSIGALAMLVFAVGLVNQRVLLTVSFLLYTAQLVNPSVIPVMTNVYASLALASVLLVGLIRGRLPRFPILRSGIFPATFVYLFLCVALLGGSVSVGESVSSIFSVAYAVGYCWVTLSACDAEEIRSSLRWSMGIIVVLSLIMVVTMPDVAIGGYDLEIVANRWRGLAANPNGLAILTGIFFFTAGSSATAVLSIPLVALMLVGTSSRAAAFAMGVVAWPQLMQGRSKLARRVAVGVACAAAVPLLYSVLFVGEETGPVDITNQSLIRSDNTREKSWSAATDSIRDNLLTGLGAGNDTRSSEKGIPVASSILRPLVELGLPGFLPLGIIAWVGLKATRLRPSIFRTLFAFMVIHGIFEGWIFAGGSMLFIVFVLSASLMEQGQPELSEQAAIPASGADHLASA